jgi:hypothetical protein
MGDASQLDQFLTELASRWNKPLRLILTGAWAVVPWTSVRATYDVDFEVNGLDAADAEDFGAATRAAGNVVGLVAEYTTDLDRWGMITMLDYRDHTHAYKRVGQLDVQVLDPKHWSIGKINRFIDTDIHDLICVFTAIRIDPLELAQFWQQAICSSIVSTQQLSTKKHARDFFKQYGKEIWNDALSLQQVALIFD